MEKEIINNENKTIIKTISEGRYKSKYAPKTEHKLIIKFPSVKKMREIFSDIVEKKMMSAMDIKFPEVQKIDGSVKVDFPDIQKIAGEVDVVFPKTQKIEGNVNANVEFPKTQKISGDVNAKVKFPEIFKVKGEVKANVEFPDIQKTTVVNMPSEFSIKNIPTAKGIDVGTGENEANPSFYVPVRLTNGKFFYDIMSQGIQTNGRLASSMDRLATLTESISIAETPITGQSRILASGSAQQIYDTTQIVKNGVIVQGLSSNIGNVYVGAQNVTVSTGFELQAGQATSIAINDLSKLYLVGDNINDGICFIAAS